jgi:hypothetical protein
MFALMKLIEDQVQWFKGIAQRQVPKIYHQLPNGWQPMMVRSFVCILTFEYFSTCALSAALENNR